MYFLGVIVLTIFAATTNDPVLFISAGLFAIADAIYSVSKKEK